MFKESPNPVGTPQRVAEVEKRVEFYKGLWDAERGNKSLWGHKVNLSKATSLILVALDDLVVVVAGSALSGPDKKATVLFAIDGLYNYAIGGLLPIWAVPFAGLVKKYIMDVLISIAIDWIVSKYQNGGWRPADTTLDRVLMLYDRSMVLCKSSCRARREK